MYLLTAIELTTGGSSTIHIYTQTVQRTTQSTQTIHRKTQSTQTVHRTAQSTQTIHRTTQSTQKIHRTTQSTQTIHRTTQLTGKSASHAPSGVCLTAEEKPRKNLSQGSRRVPVGTMKM
jgi:hypothetical protein